MRQTNLNMKQTKSQGTDEIDGKRRIDRPDRCRMDDPPLIRDPAVNPDTKSNPNANLTADRGQHPHVTSSRFSSIGLLSHRY